MNNKMKALDFIGSHFFFWLLLYIYICMYTLFSIYKVLLNGSFL